MENSEPQPEIFEANLELTWHRQSVLDLMNAYAKDPMGNGQALSNEVLKNLIPGLIKHPTTLIFLAFSEKKPVGVATCFKGFSTFNAKPIINISDFFLQPEYRRKGLGTKLLAAVEKKARDMGCCKITLEVQRNNLTAQKIYTAVGFRKNVLVRDAGCAILLAKQL